MRIVVRANEEQKKAFESKPLPTGFVVDWYAPTDLIEEAEGDWFFDLCYDSEHTSGNMFVKGKLVFANAVITTAQEFKHANYVRLNAWPGFLEKETIEIACASKEIKQWAEQAMQMLGWKYCISPDEPGMIAPRIIAMIINEAYFGLEDNISSKTDIDTAMKLGTNYPFGPFEWAEKIGLKKICSLLEKLAQQDQRYTPAQLLKQEAFAV